MTDAEFEQWAHNLVLHFPSAVGAINYYRELRDENAILVAALEVLTAEAEKSTPSLPTSLRLAIENARDALASVKGEGE